jgi:Tfp pilus assembly protein PilV
MELIVAMVFLGIVLVSLTNLFIAVRQINRAANNYTIATQAAQQLMEKFRNTPYASIPTGTTDVTTAALGTYPSLLAPRSATTTVAYITTSGAASGTDVGVKQVDVEVSYTDRTGVKKVQFSSWLSSKGLGK